MLRRVSVIISLLMLPCAVLARAVADDYVTASNRVVRSGWMNVDESHYLSGRTWSPDALNARIVVVHRWCIVCPKIDEAVKEFQNLAKQFADTDLVFLTSYYPEEKHSRTEVEETLKRLKVTTPVYVGVASMAIKWARRAHCSMYVISGGDEELWSKRTNNTDLKALTQYLKANKDELVEKSIRLAVTHAPGRALVQAKLLAKTNPKKAKELKSLTDPLNTSENRQMAEFEEKASALRVKPNAAAVKALLAKLTAFAARAPEELKDEIDELTMELKALQ